MNPHQPKVVPINGLTLGPCYRGICKCGWLGKLHPIQTFGTGTAVNLATQDADKHAKALATKLVTPDFIIHLNEESFTVDEPAWKK